MQNARCSSVKYAWEEGTKPLSSCALDERFQGPGSVPAYVPSTDKSYAATRYPAITASGKRNHAEVPGPLSSYAPTTRSPTPTPAHDSSEDSEGGNSLGSLLG
eukprot:3268338-Rhodomonas_salina.2